MENPIAQICQMANIIEGDAEGDYDAAVNCANEVIASLQLFPAIQANIQHVTDQPTVQFVLNAIIHVLDNLENHDLGAVDGIFIDLLFQKFPYMYSVLSEDNVNLLAEAQALHIIRSIKITSQIAERLGLIFSLPDIEGAPFRIVKFRCIRAFCAKLANPAPEDVEFYAQFYPALAAGGFTAQAIEIVREALANSDATAFACLGHLCRWDECAWRADPSFVGAITAGGFVGDALPSGLRAFLDIMKGKFTMEEKMSYIPGLLPVLTGVLSSAEAPEYIARIAEEVLLSIGFNAIEANAAPVVGEVFGIVVNQCLMHASHIVSSSVIDFLVVVMNLVPDTIPVVFQKTVEQLVICSNAVGPGTDIDELDIPSYIEAMIGLIRRVYLKNRDVIQIIIRRIVEIDIAANLGEAGALLLVLSGLMEKKLVVPSNETLEWMVGVWTKYTPLVPQNPCMVLVYAFLKFARVMVSDEVKKLIPGVNTAKNMMLSISIWYGRNEKEMGLIPTLLSNAEIHESIRYWFMGLVDMLSDSEMAQISSASVMDYLSLAGTSYGRQACRCAGRLCSLMNNQADGFSPEQCYGHLHQMIFESGDPGQIQAGIAVCASMNKIERPPKEGTPQAFATALLMQIVSTPDLFQINDEIRSHVIHCAGILVVALHIDQILSSPFVAELPNYDWKSLLELARTMNTRERYLKNHSRMRSASGDKWFPAVMNGIAAAFVSKLELHLKLWSSPIDVSSFESLFELLGANIGVIGEQKQNIMNIASMILTKRYNDPEICLPVMKFAVAALAQGEAAVRELPLWWCLLADNFSVTTGPWKRFAAEWIWFHCCLKAGIVPQCFGPMLVSSPAVTAYIAELAKTEGRQLEKCLIAVVTAITNKPRI